MAHLRALGLHIRMGTARNARAAGHAFDDANARAFELLYLVGIVRKQSHAAHAEQSQRGGRKTVVTRIGGEAEFFVGFHGVHAAVLQFVGAQLVHQADAASLLGKVQQYSGGRRGNFFQGKLELSAAIAALRREHVSGKALRMDAHQRRLTAKAAMHQRCGVFVGPFAFDAKDFEWTETRGQLGARNDPDRGAGLFRDFTARRGFFGGMERPVL